VHPLLRLCSRERALGARRERFAIPQYEHHVTLPGGADSVRVLAGRAALRNGLARGREEGGGPFFACVYAIPAAD